MDGPGFFYWGASWALGVPIIVVLVVYHVIMLGMIRLVVTQLHRYAVRNTVSRVAHFVLTPAITVMVATALHASEAGAWAWVYLRIGALPNAKAAMLYSLNAETSFGNAHFEVVPAWHMLGAIEALNGLILFGLTTAFLFGVMERAWPWSREG